MGWTSSRDPVQGMTLKFENKIEAIKFANEQGWAYEVKDEGTDDDDSSSSKIKPKNYADNFLYSSKKLKIIKYSWFIKMIACLP